MTCTVGRVGVPTANGGDGLSLADPFDWQVNGRSVTITGRHVASSDAAATWFAEQIMGLDPALNFDEASLPFTSTAVPSLDGYYSVESAQAAIGRGALGTGTLHVDWQVSMRRALASMRPRIEIPHTYAFLTNSLSVTSADLTLAYPYNATVLSKSFTPDAKLTRSTEFGNVALIYGDGVASGSNGYYTAAYTVHPKYFYQGGASISVTGSGGQGTVTGRRDALLSSAGVFTGTPTISNGAVRAKVAAATITVESYLTTGTPGWNSTQSFELEEGVTATKFTATSAAVLKNAADECILRVGGVFPVTAATPQECTVDLILRRGDLYVRFGCSQAVAGGFTLRPSTGFVAATSTTPGIRQTTADAFGSYWVMMSNNASTKSTVAGYLASASQLKTQFGLGYAIGVGTAATYDYTDDVGYSFYFSNATTQRVTVG